MSHPAAAAPHTRGRGRWFLRDPRAARLYFGVQAGAGALWWWGVFTLDWVRAATLGELNPVLVFWFDLPLFVCASALAAMGVRGTATLAALWTSVVAAGMALYATVTGLAGWGALCMIAAAACSVGAALILRLGRIPSERFLVGPLAARPARPGNPRRHLSLTAAQTSVFWALFLLAFPLLIVLLEGRWGLGVAFPVGWRILGAALCIGGTAVGLWSAATLARQGRGTPLPATTATALVVSGPYRYVRNPMAVGSIAQGIAVGLMASSWLVVLYAVAGGVIWDWFVRPHEEAELEARFGAPFRSYRDAVRCWIPTRPRDAPYQGCGS